MSKRFSSIFGSYNALSSGIIVAASLARILSYRFSTNTGGDALARVGATARWLEHPDFRFIFGNYPPGHFWLIAIFNFLFHDVEAAGRMLSLVLGIASLVVVSKLARLLYGDTGGILSLITFGFYSLHIAYSATSSSEVSYLFFLLLALLLFFSYLSREPSQGSRGLWQLAGSGLALSISGCIRFEAWIFFFGMLAILAIALGRDLSRQPGHFTEHLQPLLIFSVTGGLWPAWMMAYCWRNLGDPMYLVTQNHVRVLNQLARSPIPLTYLLALSPAAIAISLCIPVFIAALYGLLSSLTSTSKPVITFSALGIFFAAVQNYQILRHGMIALARYTLTLGAILAIVAGFGLERVFQKLRIGLPPAAALLTVLLIANNAIILTLSEMPSRYSEKMASVSPVLRYPRRIEDVARYLRTHLGPNDAIVVDDYNVESNTIAYAAGLPLVPGKRAYMANTQYDLSAGDYVASVHPHLMVYSDQGTLQKTFRLPPGCTQRTILDGIEFHCVYSGNIYRVYELTYLGT